MNRASRRKKKVNNNVATYNFSLEQFTIAHNELLDSLQKDYLGYDDMIDTIEQETGYRYEF